MHIHIGNRKVVSDKHVIGIFSIDTIRNSDLNERYLSGIESTECDIKTIVIDRHNGVITSKVSSFTVIKRKNIDTNDCVWSRK
jgi:hypothetical protein